MKISIKIIYNPQNLIIGSTQVCVLVFTALNLNLIFLQ